MLEGQEILKIKLNTKDPNIGSLLNHKIEYLTPSGVSGSWNAVVTDTTYLEYDLVDGDNPEAGTWQVWAYADNGAGKPIRGDVFRFHFKKIPS